MSSLSVSSEARLSGILTPSRGVISRIDALLRQHYPYVVLAAVVWATLRRHSPIEKISTQPATTTTFVANDFTDERFAYLAGNLTELIDSSKSDPIEATLASISSFKYFWCLLLFVQSIAVMLFAIRFSSKLDTMVSDLYAKLTLLKEVQDYLDRKNEDFGATMVEYSKNLALKDSKWEKLCGAVNSLWTEVNKVKSSAQKFDSSSIQAQAVAAGPSVAAPIPQPGVYSTNGAAQTTGPSNVYNSFASIPSSIQAADFRPRSVIKTQYGAFDLSTAEGRTRWKQSMERQMRGRKSSSSFGRAASGRTSGKPYSSNSLNGRGEGKIFNSKGKYSGGSPRGASSVRGSNNFSNLPSQLYVGIGEGRSGSVKECAIAATIDSFNSNASSSTSAPVSTNTGGSFLSPFDSGNENNAKSSENVEDSKAEIKTAPILTSSDLKAKLEEGEKKQYRRLFIPGRGWMSTKRLQEESEMLEKAEQEKRIVKYEHKSSDVKTLAAAGASSFGELKEQA